jgi:porin
MTPMVRASGFSLAILAGLFSAAADGESTAEQAGPTVSLQTAYAGDIRQVASGGLKSGGAYLDDLDLQLSVDFERAFAWHGAQFFFYAIYNDGNELSGDKVGDLNGVSNIETGLEALRVQEMWIDQTFAGGSLSLRGGLYDLNSEFDAGEVRALFLGSSHGMGTEFGQTGLNGPSVFPVTSLGARFNWDFGEGAYVRLAVLDGVPGDPDHPKRTTVDLSAADGALIAAEVGLANEDGRIWSLGAWTYTARFPDLETAETHGSNRGVYLAMEEPLLSRSAGSEFDLAGSFRFGVANDDINPVSAFLGTTLVATGLLADRPDDQLGLALAVAAVGDKYRAIVAGGGGAPVDHEFNLELTYYTDVTDWLSLQPDLQWIVHPGADRAIENTFVMGLRFQLKQNWDFE